MDRTARGLSLPACFVSVTFSRFIHIAACISASFRPREKRPSLRRIRVRVHSSRSKSDAGEGARSQMLPRVTLWQLLLCVWSYGGDVGQVAWRRGKQAGMGYRAGEIICSPGSGYVSDRGVCREALKVCSPRRSGAAGRAGSRQR